MGYKLVETPKGQFAIDWDIVTRIIRSYVRARLQCQYSRTVKESQTSLNPLSWALPDFQYIEVDWAKVSAETLTGTWSHGFRLAALTYQSVDAMVRELKTMQAETRRLQDVFQKQMRAASRASSVEMEKAVSTYRSLANGAAVVRDLSATILIGASTAGVGVAGSGALAMAGAGTALKSIGKYQDTGSIGSAVIEAGQNIAFTVIPPLKGAALAGNEKVAKVVISVAADTGKALLEGKSIGAAVLVGSIQLAVPAVGKVVESKPVQAVLNKTALPVATKILTGPPEMIARLPGKVTTKLAEEALKKGGRALITAAPSQKPLQAEAQRLQASPASDPLVDALTFEEDLLLKFAIVDMAQGIGRSWW